jgi:hypothetical protein
MKVFASARCIAALLALSGSIACGATTPTEPAPVYELKTETFTGSVDAGGTTAFPFTIVNPGDIQVSITALGPNSTASMGISLGFWTAATSVCTEQLSNSSATLNVAFAASPSQAGEYCVTIWDSGNVQVSSTFTLKVTHY